MLSQEKTDVNQPF